MSITKSLLASVNVLGADANASAHANCSDQCSVTDASSSGSILLYFSGFQLITLDLPGTASVSPFSITIGSFSATVTSPINP
jgi:hypothetical protein